LTNGTNFFAETFDSFIVYEIQNDAWNYGMSVSSGSIAVSLNSAAATQLTTNGTSGWALESGPVAD